MSVDEMKDLGVVYYDFENISSYPEILIRTQNRYIELIGLGFSREEILRIIFNNSSFQKSFLRQDIFERLKAELMNFGEEEI